jgi:hypothetical protein
LVSFSGVKALNSRLKISGYGAAMNRVLNRRWRHGGGDNLAAAELVLSPEQVQKTRPFARS